MKQLKARLKVVEEEIQNRKELLEKSIEMLVVGHNQIISSLEENKKRLEILIKNREDLGL